MPFVAIGSKPSVNAGAAPGGSAGTRLVGPLSLFQTTRSMPVFTFVDSVDVLFVSSGSKIELSGSIWTVFVIVPRVGGATSMNAR